MALATDPASGWPLTEAQEGLWFAQQLDPQNTGWICGQYIDLRGPLDIDAFARAHAKAVDECKALSLRFLPDPVTGAARQIAGDPPALRILDWRDHPDPLTAAKAAIEADGARPFDLSCEAPARLALHILSDDHALWSEQIHHLATDGFAIVLFTNRVATLYGAETGAGPEGAALAPLEQAINEDLNWRNAAARGEAATFWQGEMAGLDTVATPTARRAPAGPQFLRHSLSLSNPLRNRLLERAKALGIGWPDLLTLLSAAYLDRVSPAGARVFGLPYMARMGSRAARVAAMWMNVLPWRAALDEDRPLDDLARDTAAHLSRLRRHGRYRSEALRRDLNRVGPDGAVFGPLINVQPFDMPPRFAGLLASLHILGAGAVDDLSLTYRGDGATALMLEVDANPALYAPDDIAAHCDRLSLFLTAALDATRLADVPTLTPAETRWAIHDLNATDHAVPDVTLTDLLESGLRKTPDALAVICGTSRLTYAALDQRSAALAQALVARGAGPGRVVAVALPRSVELAVALLAVLRAGAAYVPLDPDQPPARLSALIARTKAITVLAEPDCNLGDTVAFPPADWPTIPDNTPLPCATPDDLAYILFTSGSTGEPKGVMIEHRAIVNRLLWMRDHYGFSAADRILQKTPLTFDVSVWELFLPAICGALQVFAPPGAHRDPNAIAALVREHGITTMHFVPSMLAAFLEAPAAQGLHLRRVFASGEALPAALRSRFHALVTAELHNLYGPTEAAVDISYWNAGPKDDSNPLPIGFPVWNARLYVLDARMRPVPPGVAGELFLGGVQLARGYLGEKAMTADRFRPDPFRPDARIYATGDLATLRPDGAVIYLGRNDHQVKIRGMRVEPDEIAAILGAVARDTDPVPMRDVLVVAAGEGAATHLVAYVLADAGLDTDALARALADRLPLHMLPRAILRLDAWPLTASGKLDRKALPRPVLAQPDNTPPRSPTEKQVAAAMAEVLSLPIPPGREADFFALGGDSLAAVRLVLALERRLGRDPGLGQVFETPSVAALARALDQAAEAQAGLGPLLDLGGDQSPPLFILHPAGGLGWGYRRLARALAPRRVIALQAPIFTTHSLPDSLAALAADHAARIMQGAPDGLLHLAGWSVGGILAQDIACHLTAQGRQVGMVALLDAYPCDVWRNEPEPDPAAALRALLAIAGHDPDTHAHLTTRAAVVAFLKQGGTPLGSLPEPVLDRVVTLVTGTNRLIRGHSHRHYNGPLLHLRAAGQHQDTALTGNLWQPYANGLKAVDLPFRHAEMIGPAAVAALAPVLRQAMDQAEASANAPGNEAGKAAI